MIPDRLRQALQQYKDGSLSESELDKVLEGFPFQDLGFAKVDHHRAIRHGFPEVIFGKGKALDHVVEIAKSILAKNPNLLITHAGRPVFDAVKEHFPTARYHQRCTAVTIVQEKLSNGRGKIGIFSAGTADIPVAEEASVTAEIMGNEVLSCYDVGVAGLHRLLSHMEELRSCSVVVVVAGMEGALPSVVGGLVNVPVIAVPTSIGYGASFGGLAALLGMLNSCSSNVTVVNIDNGFGAGYVASLINRKREFDTP